MFSGLFLFIIIYSVFQTSAISKGVALNINNIKDGQIFDGEIVTLVGTAMHAVHLSVNGKEIAIDEENAFSEELVLSDGYNIITLEAEDKFGKVTKESFRVLYESPASPVEEVAKLPN